MQITCTLQPCTHVYDDVTDVIASVYCEIGFSTRSLGGEWLLINLHFPSEELSISADHIITFTREANESFGCDVFV